MIPKIKKLFISYRSTDAAKVDKIARDLGLFRHDDGTPCYKTWQDKINLPPASPHWWDAIVDAIIDCDVFVFNMSKASLQSDVCLAELDYAHKRNRPVIPVVLEGEFFRDPNSGKYDITYWGLIPEWLRDVQFLFYVGTAFYDDFQVAIKNFERKWPRDINASRPMNPDSKSVHGSNHAIYDTACDYAERLAFADAEKHFDALLRRNDSDYADVAAEWIELLRFYAELIEIDERRSARFIFKSKWADYQALFPKIFLEDIFDPKGFANKKGKASSKPVGAIRESPAAPPPSTLPGQRLTAADILPAPFAWIEIPGGRGTMETDESVTLDIPTQKYWIAKYPTTNAQFAKFIEAGGYENEQWWTKQGWETRQKEKWTQPYYWTDKEWNGAEQPVVGMSWYEAVAFCLWLSDVTGEKIMLPTEDQWQYAAQGDDGRTYPWGNDWDTKRCNNKDAGHGRTTPVTQYEGKNKGDSPFGVVDMAGNVWEWCLTDYKKGTNDCNSYANSDARRVLRGGSWNYYYHFARCAYRYDPRPDNRNSNCGFRLCRPPSL